MARDRQLQELVDRALALLDADLRARVEKVQTEVRAARDRDTALVYDRLKGKSKQWRPTREDIHDELVDEAIAQAQQVPAERTAIIMGGLSGAGKTTILTSPMGRLFGVQLDANGRVANYLIVNSDDFKRRLLERGLGPRVDALAPLETSSLVHTESGKIADDLSQRASAAGTNLIWDTTMGTLPYIRPRVDELHGDGYTVVGVFVDVSIEHALTAVMKRYADDTDRYLRDGKGIGGRFIPPDVVLDQIDATGRYRSKNRANFEDLKPHLDQYFVVDNEGYRGELIEQGP